MFKLLRGSALVFAGLLFLILFSGALAAPPTTRERLAELGGEPCPNGSAFTCVTLNVPLDHFNPSDPRTMDVVFAVLPAPRPSKGMYVTVTGGPGTSGVLSADAYAPYYDPRLLEHFDMVFFDQRGRGLSGGLNCPNAASNYYKANWSARTQPLRDQVKEAARALAQDCFVEMGRPEILPYLGTAQAIRDLDLFRSAMGQDKFYLYGESYGSQYAQEYAAAFGERVAGLILDGVIDLTLEDVPFYANAAESFNDTLVKTLAACYDNLKCRADFATRPLKGYDRLIEQLESENVVFEFPLGDGTRVTRELAADDLELVGIAQMYSPGGRMLFARALAAATRYRDMTQLARILYNYLVLDPVTLQPQVDPGWSDAFYYAVMCQDYGFYEGNKSARADKYITDALLTEQGPSRLTSIAWSDLPCTFWRNSPETLPRPQYRSLNGIPTFVLIGEADPIARYENARTIYEHLDNGYLITRKDGQHVIYGYGMPCIDTPVNEFLLNDVLPAQRETNCGGKIMAKYVPIAPLDASEFPSLLAAFQSAENEGNYLPDYWFWDFAAPLRVGCTQGGWMEYVPENTRVRLVLDHCAFSRGFAMTGSGLIHYNVDRFGLTVNVTGDQTCSAQYTRKGNDTNVTGDCDGSPFTDSGYVDASEFERPNLLASRRFLPSR